MSRKGNDFDYNGYLVFNGLYRSEIQSELDDQVAERTLKDRIDDRLPEYEAHTNSANSGYSDINLVEHLSAYNYGEEGAKLSPGHLDFSKDILAKKYINEKTGSQTKIISEDNQRVSGEKIETTSAYLYWKLPNLLLIQGGKDFEQNVARNLYQSIGAPDPFDETYSKLRPVKFNPHFFLWMVYKDSKNEKIGRGTQLTNIESIKLSGDRDAYGESAEVSGSIDILRSTPVIEGLMKGKLPQRLVATFEMGDQDLEADISADGRVHIMVDKDIKESTKLERLILGLQFVENLISLSEEWDSKSIREKFVQPTFVEELSTIAKDEGVEISFQKSLVKDLLNRREESRDDYDFDFSP